MKFRNFVRLASAIAVLSLSASVSLSVEPAVSCECSKYDAAIKEPPGTGSKEGLAFSHTGDYRAEFKSAVADAKAACNKYLAENKPADNKKGIAVVADIDETVLDNREHFEGREKFAWGEFAKWIDEARAPSLKPTAEFLKWARKKGFAVFLVTGRPENLRAPTIRNLVRNGIAYDGLYLRASDDRRSAIEVKSAVRKSIEDLGFTIVVNIGDQVSDLVGGHSIDCEKLPNKIYFVP